MTEGAGGGTISAAALYYEMHDVVDETINITFIEACEALFAADLPGRIHAMTDVTNGRVRGDAKEISRTARVKLVFFEEKMRNLVNPKVLSMLESLEIDYLGVSLDALLLIAPPDDVSEIIDVIRGAGVRIDVVGEVRDFGNLHTPRSRNSSARQRQMITNGCVRLSTMQQRRRWRSGIGWWQGCEARKLVSGAGAEGF